MNLLRQRGVLRGVYEVSHVHIDEVFCILDDDSQKIPRVLVSPIPSYKVHEMHCC